MEQNKISLATIELLITSGFDILFISNEWYVVSEFEPATDVIRKHYVRGYPITEQLKTLDAAAKAKTTSTIEAAVQKIADPEKHIRIAFHGDEKFINYYQ
jgi:hypothetical protein